MVHGTMFLRYSVSKPEHMNNKHTTQEAVTVNDKKPVVKEKQSENQKQSHNGLAKEDLPDATKENTGNTGSGQRQDSN